MSPPTQTFISAQAALAFLQPLLARNEATANVILPILLKSVALELRGRPLSDQYWIVHQTNLEVDLILSLTHGAVGTYPAFICSPAPYELLARRDWLLPRMKELVEEVFERVPHRRVYSVFAQQPVTSLFVELWTQKTGITPIADPYYDSWMSYRTREQNVVEPKPKDGSLIEMRPARDEDLNQIAELCLMFAAECEPFVLDEERAKLEARGLIRNNQIWVCRAKREGEWRVASICATTRNSRNVATITKVFTHPDFRRNRLAECLVNRVSEHWLKNENKELRKDTIVLYVGVDNPARHVYAKVGFVGLKDSEPRPAGVDRWVETGFERSQVDLGHW